MRGVGCLCCVYIPRAWSPTSVNFEQCSDTACVRSQLLPSVTRILVSTQTEERNGVHGPLPGHPICHVS